MASNLLAMASKLLAMASNLLGLASNLLGLASNLRAMASNLGQQNWWGAAEIEISFFFGLAAPFLVCSASCTQALLKSKGPTLSLACFPNISFQCIWAAHLLSQAML